MARYKKLFCFIFLASLSVLLSGCIRMKMDITVKRNGKADISLLYAAQEGLASLADSEDSPFSITPEKAEEYRQEGWEVTEYAEDGYSGYLLAQKNTDLSRAGLSDTAEGSLRKEGSLYILDLSLLSEEDQKNIASYAPFIKSADGFMTIRITLPVKPEKHNATTVSEDGKTLEWDILEMEPGDTIHAEVRLPNIALWAGIAALLAAAAAFIIFRKRSGKKTDHLADIPAGPAAAAEIRPEETDPAEGKAGPVPEAPAEKQEADPLPDPEKAAETEVNE